MHEEKQSDDSRIDELDQVFNGGEVLQAFRHLAAVYVKMAHMDEVLYPSLLLKVGLRLCQLVLVVREDQVDASRVDIDLRAQDFRCHC